ncbi:unnamed protein product [Schistosoma turkestanicum]|nr:unnamed protein product [Schistosoma turkestanicum]
MYASNEDDYAFLTCINDDIVQETTDKHNSSQIKNRQKKINNEVKVDYRNQTTFTVINFVLFNLVIHLNPFEMTQFDHEISIILY